MQSIIVLWIVLTTTIVRAHGHRTNVSNTTLSYSNATSAPFLNSTSSLLSVSGNSSQTPWFCALGDQQLSSENIAKYQKQRRVEQYTKYLDTSHLFAVSTSQTSQVPASVQSSVTNAFDPTFAPQTSIVFNGSTVLYTRTTFADLATITAPTTVTTPILNTEHGNSQSTTVAGVIIVGPGGTWWNGGTDGLNLHALHLKILQPDDYRVRLLGLIVTGTTTTTTKSTETPAIELCSPDCPSCNPGDTLKPRISVKKQKRVLPTPSGNAIATFIDYQTDHARRVRLYGDTPTALFEKLVNDRLDTAVTGLWGCTSVIVVSKKGVYMSHIWEADLKLEGLDFNPVIKSLLFGNGPFMPGFRPYHDAYFGPESEPATIIVTPRKYPRPLKVDDKGKAIEFSQPMPGELEYPVTVGRLKALLEIQVKGPESNPDVDPIIVDYVADKKPATRMNNVSGKVLFQYDPVQGRFPDPNNNCELYQEARFRLWMGTARQPILDKGWHAHPDQLVPQNGKRALPAKACGLSLSSLDGVTASGQAVTSMSNVVQTPTTSSVSKTVQWSTLATIHRTSTITVIPIPLSTPDSSVHLPASSIKIIQSTVTVIPLPASSIKTIQSTVTVIPLPATSTTLPPPVPTLNVPGACAGIYATRDLHRHEGAHCIIPYVPVAAQHHPRPV
ncbi:hypothetical protein G7Y79_00010g029030 [Physcia stellaris]|nr:hypothetical protein G7Y79_00010g029030 [Physcia stellaris]